MLFIMLAIIFSFLALQKGCMITGGSVMNTKYERTVDLSTSLKSNSHLSAETYNGFIKVAGGKEEKCALVATIHAHAPTREEAKQIAEQTQVKLVPSGKGLRVDIQKPELKSYRSVSVDLDVHVPGKTSLDIKSYNGCINLEGITEPIKAVTYNGEITGRDITNQIEVETYNGCIALSYAKAAEAKKSTIVSYNSEIKCDGIRGDLNVKTYNGEIDAVYAKDAPGACNIAMEAYNGHLTLVTPSQLSARIEASTTTGSISTCFPIPVKGFLAKSLDGTVGAGEGKIVLKTYNGSINIK
jgi:DUF4097 and DUF4098 domain-containing protein YvlB